MFCYQSLSKILHKNWIDYYSGQYNHKTKEKLFMLFFEIPLL